MTAFLEKPPGAEYWLEFRDPERSLGREVAKLAVIGSSSYCLPDFAPECVCCEASTDRRQETVPRSGGKVGAVSLPVCESCAAHAVALADDVPVYVTAVGVVLLMGGAAGLFVYGATWYWGALLAAAVLVMSAGGWLAHANLRRQRTLKLDGHWPWMKVGAAANLFRVQTRNAALARRLSKSPFMSQLK